LKGSGHAQSVGDDVVDGCDEGDVSSAQGFRGTMGVKQGERRLTTGDDVMVQDDPPALTVDVIVSLLRLPNRSTYNRPPRKRYPSAIYPAQDLIP
jgi:hypothetical protein